MSAWQSPRSIAINAITSAYGGGTRRSAAAITDLVLDRFEEPDRDMIEAGLAALRNATGLHEPNQQRAVEAIWRAMMRRGRK